MRILITGGAGFIGSHLADRLVERGDDVLVVDNFATARRDNVVPHPRRQVADASIADPQVVGRLFAEFQPELVVHAAASYKDPENWAEDVQTNVHGTANVVRASQHAGIRRLIYLQTALCYGLHPKEQPITLNHPLDPKGSSYAITKTAGEHFIALSGLPFVSFRLANVYGPRNVSGPLPTFFQRLTTAKKCFVMKTRRDFVFVDDLLAVVVKAIDGLGSTGYYHVSSGSDSAIKDIFDATVEALGITLDEAVEVRERGPDDAFTILLDPSKTCADFGWQAVVPLSEGVRRTIDYYKQYGVAETYTHLAPVAE